MRVSYSLDCNRGFPIPSLSEHNKWKPSASLYVWEFWAELFTESDSSELYNRYPRREALSDTSGTYELTAVKPLDIQRSVYYLVSSNAAIRAKQFFFGQVTATRPRGDYNYTEPQLKSEAKPPPPEASTEHAVAGHRAAFKRRCDADKQTYGEELFREIKKLYQSANKDLKSPGANGVLKSLIEKYPKSNRAGCAAQYLGQHASGEEKENFLRTAIRDFSDCYYGSGVQVGAYARFYLGRHYMSQGKSQEATDLFDEVRRDYPDAVTHQGQLLVNFLPR